MPYRDARQRFNFANAVGFKTKANRPGECATIRAKYDLPTGVTAPQTCVHHCRILEHEDNDMIRPFTVIA